MFKYLATHFGVGDTDDDSGDARRGGAAVKPTPQESPDAAWVWQLVVVVTVVALVAYITCGCGDAGSGKPTYTAVGAREETSPRAAGRATSPAMQPLAVLIHSALSTSAAAKKQ